MSKFVLTTSDGSSDPGHQAQFVNLDRVDSFHVFTANEGKFYIGLKSSVSHINGSTVNREFESQVEANTGARLLADVVNMSATV